METGRVKQAYNNEIISLRKNFNQAKIQIIHKLTRKAKTLTEKKAPEKLQEKLKRKAESAVKEVLIMKKVKPRDIGKFAVTHTGKLQDYLNKPTVDQDKACARLLLHKSLQEKYKFIRSTFSNIPISDLLMSRSERLRLKKEALMKQKMKRDKKKKKVVNSEGEWRVENVKSNINKDLKESTEDKLSGDEEEVESGDGRNLEDEREHSDVDESSQSDINEQSEESDVEMEAEAENDQETSEEDSLKEETVDVPGKFVRPSPIKDSKPKLEHAGNKEKKNASPILTLAPSNKNKNKPEIKKQPKVKDAHKNKNLNEKLLTRKFKKDLTETKVKETKIVDPFFITATGENYMSVAEPRQPDEVKEIHKQGNRKLRRAAMFGHVPKIKSRQDVNQNNFNRQNDGQSGFRSKSDRSRNENYNSNFDRDSQFKNKDNQFKNGNVEGFRNRNDNQFKGRNDSQFKDRNDSKFGGKNEIAAPKVEKLHPSWEAKKKQSGILPFQGKKIVFDES